LPDSDHLFGSSSDDGHNDNNVGDDDSKTHTLHVVANILHLLMSAQLVMPFLVATTKGDGDSGDEDNDGNDDMDNGSKIPFPCPLQLVTPLLPILSNQVVTKMLSVAEMMPMSCCCHALTTLCNNVFLLLIPPHL
jgi:hypothetical protein